MKISTLVLSSCLFLLILSCKPDEPKSDISLKGKWNIHEALRNGKVTKTLKGGYFVYESDTSFSTNIFGEDNIFIFKMIGNKLITTSGQPELRLKLSTTHPDSMVLSGRIKYFNMEFRLVRDTVLEVE